MNKIAYTNPTEGITCIVIPAPKEKIEKVVGKLTDEEYEAHVRALSIPADAINVMDVADADLPIKDEFRNSWVIMNGKVDHDLSKAKDIQLKRVRLAREPKLLDLDKQYMLAEEKGDLTAKANVAAQKQALRDITQPLKDMEPKNIDEIRLAFPEILRSDV